jgi:hypothetical protein
MNTFEVGDTVERIHTGKKRRERYVIETIDHNWASCRSTKKDDTNKYWFGLFNLRLICER